MPAVECDGTPQFSRSQMIIPDGALEGRVFAGLSLSPDPEPGLRPCPANLATRFQNPGISAAGKRLCDLDLPVNPAVGF